MPRLRLAHQQLPGVTVIAVIGEMDATNRAQLEAYIAQVQPEPAGRLVFDLSEVPFMDSSGLHVLLTCATNCLKDGGAVHLAAVQRMPARLFELTGIMTHVPVHDTVQGAITAALAS